MRKRIKTFAFVFGIFVFCLPAFSQPAINGPVCVLPGVTYQYTIGDSSVSTTQINMQICIHGGSIADKDGNRLNDCTESTEPLATVLVMWDDTTNGSVTISTSEGNKSLNVNITSELQAGLVDSSIKQQNFSDTISIPSIIICSRAKGGSCSPNYSYQWQQSNDAMVWADIDGSTAQNLSFATPVSQSFFYRRKITETNSGTIGYSDIAVINVLPFVQSDSSGINDFTGQQTRDEYHNMEYGFLEDQDSLFRDKSNGCITYQFLLNSHVGSRKKQELNANKTESSNYKYF